VTQHTARYASNCVRGKSKTTIKKRQTNNANFSCEICVIAM
jgi:hypothetical protein